VNLITRMGGQPSLDPGMLMGSVVVDNQVDSQIRWHIGIHLFEKLKVFLMAVAVFTAGEYLTSCDVQCGK